MATMATDKSAIGYYVAAAGALFLAATLVLMATGRLDDKAITITLIVVSAALLGMGLYVVVPKEMHDAVTDYGGVARDMVPRLGLRRQPDSPSPTVTEPAAGQTTIVKPPGAPGAVAVSPSGEAIQITDDEADAATEPDPERDPERDPEVVTQNGMPAQFRSTRKEWSAPNAFVPKPPTTNRVGKRNPIGEGTRNRQELFPPGEA